MTSTVLRPLLVASLLLAAACAGVGTSRPGPDTLGDRPVRIEARQTPIGPIGADLAPGVAWAGGLTLRGSAFHGLSDLKVAGDRAVAVSDFGHRIAFTLRLDDRGRLSDALDAVSRPLVDAGGAPLSPKARADAEGLALLDDGRILVSFERDHRIWSYGTDGDARPAPVPFPAAGFADNQGMEGLAASSDQGWLVLGETGGAWSCAATGCNPLPAYAPLSRDGFLVTGADRAPGGGWFIVERFFAPPLDMRARIRRMAPDGSLGPVLIALRPPASVDNFEGIAAVATAVGTRLYLLSDDNDNPLQRTLLLAFDLAAPPP